MPKYKTLVDFSFDNPGSTEIANYYNDTDTSLRVYYNDRSATKFFGYTPEETQAELERRLAELDATCAFTLLADLEATFKIDYLQRCYKKKKEPISRAFRDFYEEVGSSISLGRQILPAWKEHHPEFKGIIGTINSAINYRDWIAHGRYWTPSLGRRYDFVTVYQIYTEAEATFPFMSA
jgi:hypothetical protein